MNCQVAYFGPMAHAVEFLQTATGVDFSGDSPADFILDQVTAEVPEKYAKSAYAAPVFNQVTCEHPCVVPSLGGACCCGLVVYGMGWCWVLLVGAACLPP